MENPKTFIGPPEPKHFRLSGAYQTAFSMRVPCNFCRALVNEYCKPSVIFPQYPHSSRFNDAFKGKPL